MHLKDFTWEILKILILNLKQKQQQKMYVHKVKTVLLYFKMVMLARKAMSQEYHIANAKSKLLYGP